MPSPSVSGRLPLRLLSRNPPMTRLVRLCSGALLALVVTLPLTAASPTRWQVSSAADWLEGRSEQVAIDRQGRITLGPALTEIHEDTAPSIWDVVVGPNGRLYAGTGNDGRVIAIDDGKSTTLFDSDELQMHALAWHRDALLAASSPDGRVYRVTPDGEATPFFDPEDGYIWALAVGPDDDVFVATGNKARVYRVNRSGADPKVVFESAAANVTAIAIVGNSLLVGTENPGRLYRVPLAGGRAFALMDGPHTQIQAIRPQADGRTFVLAVSPTASASSGSSAPASTSSEPTPVVTTEVSIVAIGDAVVMGGGDDSGKSGASGSAKGTRGKGTVYTLPASGLVETYWDVTAELPFDIAPLPDGGLLLTTEEGALFRLDGNPVRASRLGQTASEQVTRVVARGDDGYVLAGANPGKLYALAGSAATRGTYTSKVRDAEVGASWGLLQWDGSVPDRAAVTFETRSGNTGTPDDTWAEWQPVRDDDGALRIESPGARFLQWRATLTAASRGDAPVVDAVTVSYLGTNRRPRVSSLTVHAPGVVFQQPFGTQEPPELAGYASTTPAPARDRALAATATAASSAAVGRRLYQKGFQTLQWDGQDADDDDLRYRVLLRRVGTDTWQELARDLTGTVYTWDTTQQADGRYFVRVVASDARANPASAALEGEREQGPLTIDNTAPTIAEAGRRRGGDDARLRVTVTDAHSPLSRVDVLQADGRWMALFPEDGVLDGRTETFAIERSGLRGDAVVVRAADTLANIATLALPVTTAGR